MVEHEDRDETGVKVQTIWARIHRRLLSPSFGRFFASFLMALAILLGVLTYAMFSGVLPVGVGPQNLVTVIYVDLILLLLIGAFVARKIVAVWSARRRGSAGAQLHTRLVVFFSALAVAPAIIVSIFSLLFFDLGLESWFSERVRTALSESRAVAEAYLLEHQKNIQADALQVAREISRDAPLLEAKPAVLEKALNVHSQLRGITEAMIFNPTAGIKARAGLTFALELEPIPEVALDRARAGEVSVLNNEQDDRVIAIVQLDNFLEETFLLIGRYVDPKVLSRIEATKSAVNQFERLEQTRSDIQLSFALSFLMVAMLLLLAAVWLGLNFASRLTQPISLLIAATEKVRGGELSARVPELSKADELGTLSRAFNRMTDQLQEQRKELVEAANQIDERRRFTEAVLTGVTAGVIGLDLQGRIDLPNRSASNLLGVDLDEYVGHELADIVPELASALDQVVETQREQVYEEEINLDRNGDSRVLFVRITVERDAARPTGFVVTLDDVSDLLAAQRKAAWADVARRIAHEIKNPLTPIQLSAERLKRKYLKEIQSDPKTFQNCIDTIVRQVDDIGRMVGEFSSFARMPKPTIQNQNLTDLCRQAVFLQRNGNPQIHFETDVPADPVPLACDGRQVSQVLTNILQNACDSIEGRDAKDEPGRVVLRLQNEADRVTITIEDNGVGLPVDGRDRLTEPYMTTRNKGTGLGLAIVKKIMEDHNGRLTLSDPPDERQGALVSLIFRKNDETSETGVAEEGVEDGR